MGREKNELSRFDCSSEAREWKIALSSQVLADHPEGDILGVFEGTI